MFYYSTKNKNNKYSFKEAILNGLAEDGGLYMPENIPSFKDDFLNDLKNQSFQETSFSIIKHFVDNEIDNNNLLDIINNAINFPAPLYKFDKSTFVLELFHGPTLAFKDFGARFMAATMSYFLSDTNQELNILVATSGDTGSAVASGFYNTPGINVFILYPSAKVSRTQEMQLTTMGGNVTALEIDGTFDDCQRLVKEAFVDKDLSSRKKLSSANSINIARLLPQSFYYYEAFKQIKNEFEKVIFSVPSGNLGNLTAGLIAKKMGLPVEYFVSATNINSVFTEYINSGEYKPRDSVKTFSNAMDVGRPSNLDRINSLYYNDITQIRNIIKSSSHNDSETMDAIKSIYKKFNYVIDPHGAVGYLSLEKFAQDTNPATAKIILETAHYSKFLEIVQQTVDADLELHPTLKECLNKKKKSTKLSNRYSDLKEFLIYS